MSSNKTSLNKTITRSVSVGDKAVLVEIELLELKPGEPYAQSITARHEGHEASHRIVHGTDKFDAASARAEIERVVRKLSEHVATMSDVKAFLDEFHQGRSGESSMGS